MKRPTEDQVISALVRFQKCMQLKNLICKTQPLLKQEFW